MESSIVLITGAANGIGAELATRLAGKNVYLCLIDFDTSANFQNVTDRCIALGSKVDMHLCDVRNVKKLKNIIHSYFDQGFHFDLVFANAGISPKPKEEYSLKSAQALMDTNYFGVINTVQPIIDFELAFPTSRKIRFVTTGSIGARITTQFSGTYSASKSALLKYFEGLELRFADSRFNFTYIECGFVATRVNEGLAHAGFLSIPASVASRKIIKVINTKKSFKSIPVARNLPWILLSMSTRKIRRQALIFVYRIFYR